MKRDWAKSFTNIILSPLPTKGIISRLTDEKEAVTILKEACGPRSFLGIPGNPVTKFICDNCHYKGHRATNNRGNKRCPYLPCIGFEMCGLESKHADHKQAIAEVST